MFIKSNVDHDKQQPQKIPLPSELAAIADKKTRALWMAKTQCSKIGLTVNYNDIAERHDKAFWAAAKEYFGQTGDEFANWSISNDSRFIVKTTSCALS